MVLRIRDEIQLYREAFATDLTGRALFDRDGKWLRVNRSLCRILGREEQELRTSSVPDYFPQVAAFLDALPTGNGPLTDSFVCSYPPLDAPPAQWLHVHVSAPSADTDRPGERRVGIMQVLDITEREQSMQLLVQSEKLSAAGQLAAGIAHEIRNPLTSLKGFLHLMKANNGNPAKHDAYVTIMNDELNRIDQILSELLVLSKPQSVQFVRSRAASIIRQVLDILQPQAVLKNVQLLTDQLDETVSIYCDENQIKQVLINLVKNGIEAMPNGGRILIGLTADQRRVSIAIADEGGGMPEETLKRLGEPFYTTKEKGTGLGLMVSFKIVENHGGTIQVDSEQNRGTRFTVTLPRAEFQRSGPASR